MDDSVTQHILAGAKSEVVQAARVSHIGRMERIVKRSSSAVDIDEFVSRLTQQQVGKIGAFGGAVKRGAQPVMNEFDKALKNLKRK